MALLCGLYLLNVFRLGHDESWKASVCRGCFAAWSSSAWRSTCCRECSRAARRRTPATRRDVFAWIDAFLLPEPTPGGPSQGELRWTANLPQAIAQARVQQKKVFVDFTGETCTNLQIQRAERLHQAGGPRAIQAVQPRANVYRRGAAQVLRRQTDRRTPETDARANLAFQRRKFGTEQLPLYVILEPQPNGKVRVVDMYDEGKINNVEKFVAFLKRPVAADTARADAGK